MTPQNKRIIDELKKTNLANLPKLIQFMSKKDSFFWCWSGKHDHWTNGTAQHSWRVYQYMRYMHEHPETVLAYNWNDPQLSPDQIRALNPDDIILAGLLHDVGKVWGCSRHASKSAGILNQYLENELLKTRPHVLAAIYFHHNRSKDGGSLNKYKDTTLRKLLNKADSMASGTSWNTYRYQNGRTQHSGVTVFSRKQLLSDAMDRTRQTLEYRMYLDSSYNLQTVVGYSSRKIEWNAKEDLVKKAKESVSFNHEDIVTAAHNLCTQQNAKATICVGVEPGIITDFERNLRSNNSMEQSLLICSNILMAFYRSKSDNFKYEYCMRPEIVKQYSEQTPGKGIYLPEVTFIRDGDSGSYAQVAPWTADLLLIPGWRGGCILLSE